MILAQNWQRLGCDHELDTAGYALFTFNEAISFEGEHHLVDGGCGDRKVPLHICFSGWAPEHARIGIDEGQVLPLSGGEAGLCGRDIFVKELIHFGFI